MRIYKRQRKSANYNTNKFETLKAVGYYSEILVQKFGVMKTLGVLAVLTAVLVCISAAPITCDSPCCIEPVSPTGRCAYCLEPMNTSLADGGLRALYHVMLDSTYDLDDLFEIVNILLYYNVHINSCLTLYVDLWRRLPIEILQF